MALKDLNTAIDLNEDYVKAIMKRSELYLQMEILLSIMNYTSMELLMIS